MKKATILFLLAMIASTAGMSQQASLADTYWVVETHNRDSIYSVVRFFDGSNKLIHEVRLENVAIDINQKKNRRRLDQLLANYKMRASGSAKKLRPRMSV